MSIITILEKLTEVFISETFAATIGRNRSRTRRLARELLEVYEDLAIYIRNCGQFAELLDRERRLVPSGRITPGTARDLQALARAMANMLRQLIVRFGNEFHRTFVDEDATGKQSRRVRTILEVMDPELASVIDSVYDDETGMVISLDLMTCNLIDESHISIPPDLMEAMQKLRLRSHDPTYTQTAIRRVASGEPSALEELGIATTLDLRDEVQFATVHQMLTNSIEGATRLREAIGSHLRNKYTIDDLL